MKRSRHFKAHVILLGAFLPVALVLLYAFRSGTSFDFADFAADFSGVSIGFLGDLKSYIITNLFDSSQNVYINFVLDYFNYLFWFLVADLLYSALLGFICLLTKGIDKITGGLDHD